MFVYESKCKFVSKSENRKRKKELKKIIKKIKKTATSVAHFLHMLFVYLVTFESISMIKGEGLVTLFLEKRIK